MDLENEVFDKNGYDFYPYNKEQMEHIEDHLDGKVAGSQFAEGAYLCAKDLIDDVLHHVKDYEGKRKVIEIDVHPCELWDSDIVGYDGVISLDELPEGTEVKQEERRGYMANVVSGVPKKETNHLVIVVGPLKEEGKHGFYTIFPGENAPRFPAGNTEDEIRANLQEWYKDDEGADIEGMVAENLKNKEYWDNHAFVKEDE
jgi:hypothetical protein